MISRRLVLMPVLALAASSLVAASPGSADPGNPFAITSVRAGDLRLSSGACRTVPFAVTHDGDAVDGVQAEVEISSGGRLFDKVLLSSVSPGQISGTYRYCPTISGLGTLVAGPSTITYATPGDEESTRFRDETTTSFMIKQDARVSNLRAKRSHRKRTFTGTASFYNVEAVQWYPVRKDVRVLLQREARPGTWRTVTSTRVRKRGAFTMSVSASGAHRYRVILPGDTKTWPATSKTLRR